ncbi:MAG: hypothetical protein JSV44_02435 [Candidatus Zixiibacteriota bacterium]|nr:MAG: hypothetical protein JSV44_02435 [candidate division Zixibacteria bacterium]
MFEELLRLFGKENLLDQAFKTTVKMLESDEEMFHASVNSLRRLDTAELPFDIYEKDKQINKYEREVRRNVLTHLTVSDSKNVLAGLILISIVIDVERIGDYTKNIAELAAVHPERLHGGLFEQDLVEIEKPVEARFRDLTKAMLEHDSELAREIMLSHKDISRSSDNALTGIMAEKDKSLTPGNAVVLALYFRYLKRIAAHLTNIASSIINPFPRIGFREK